MGRVMEKVEKRVSLSATESSLSFRQMLGSLEQGKSSYYALDATKS